MEDSLHSAGGGAVPPRVSVTPAAEALIERLRRQHGPLMFHQSGGCCDGSSPMCYPEGQLRIGSGDVLLGEIAGCRFWMGVAQFEYWRHTHLTIDCVPGRGSGFSIEAPEGFRFLTRSRLFSDAETALLEAAPEPLSGEKVMQQEALPT